MPGAKKLPGMALGLAAGYCGVMAAYILYQLGRVNIAQALATNQPGVFPTHTELPGEETAHYVVEHHVRNEVERITYMPRQRRFETPLLCLHGMFHSVACWRTWQGLWAERGWQSTAFSLPGHGLSISRKSIRTLTLVDYLVALKAELERLPGAALVAHSMGGAITQWYLKFAGELPAAVMVAPWVAHSVLADGFWRLLRADPLSPALMLLGWSATPWVRSPERAARLFLGMDAVVSPEDFYASLGPESALVLFQHNPPFWCPPQAVRTPTLWLAAENDSLVSSQGLRRSAAQFRGEFHLVRQAAHNLMMERDHRQTAELIHQWLLRQGLK
jgi:pimeloyl-ACP methyl ester carboxylesterase